MNKHLEKAEKYFQKGKLDSALEEYLLAWKDDPSNDAIVYTVADLYQTMKRGKEAMECYNFLFEKAMERSDPQKAVELMRKMQVSGTVESAKIMRLAQSLEKPRPDLAAEQYRRLMDLAGEQDPHLKLECLQGLLRISPGSLEVTRRVAETASKLGRREVARSSFQRLADQMIQIGKWGEAAAALDQVVRLDPSDMSAQISLARAYLKNNEPLSVLSLWEGEETRTTNLDVARLLVEALCASDQPEKAEALTWRVADQDPEISRGLFEIARGYFDRGDERAFEGFLQRLESNIGAGHAGKEAVALVEKLAGLPHKTLKSFERITRLMDRMNMDAPLAAALSKLMEMQMAAGEYSAAAEKLENLAAIDPYNPESTRILETLRGKIPADQYSDLSRRLGFSPADQGTLAPTNLADATTPALASAAQLESRGQTSSTSSAQATQPSAGSLKDLMLQAEIFLQYGMTDKARERFDRIVGSFPGEEEHNEDLRALFAKAGYRRAGESRSATASATPSEPAAEQRDLRADLKRISEISRNLSRQGTIKAVISAAVNDLGRFLQVSRCIVGLATPNRPPSMVMEYISPGVKSSDGASLGRLVMAIQQSIAGKNFPLVAENVTESPMLAGMQEALKLLNVDSLVAVPLRDGDQDTGVLILQECGRRRLFRGNDLAALEALAEQIVMAVANVRLRNLMKALAVTDERSGLLHRDSYLTCLTSETERMRTQKTPLTIGLLQFVSPAAPDSGGNGRKGEDKALDDFIHRFSGAVMQQLRQNDIALKYTSRVLALVLPGATGKDSTPVMEKMKRLAINTAAGSGTNPPELVAGFAEAIREGTMDNVDRVTELINRVEWALDEAVRSGGGTVRVMEPPRPRPAA